MVRGHPARHDHRERRRRDRLTIRGALTASAPTKATSLPRNDFRHTDRRVRDGAEDGPAGAVAANYQPAVGDAPCQLPGRHDGGPSIRQTNEPHAEPSFCPAHASRARGDVHARLRLSQPGPLTSYCLVVIGEIATVDGTL